MKQIYSHIPSDWVTQKLSSLGDCIIGLTYKPKDVVENGGKLVLRSSNVKGMTVSYDNNVYVDVAVPEKLIVKRDDILICVRNGSRKLIGKCALIDKNAEGKTFGAFMSVFRSPKARYLIQLFQTDMYKRQIHINLGATINQITSGNLNSFIFPIPPESERNEIIRILSFWDKSIEHQKNLIELKMSLKKGLMQQLLSGKRRFPGFNSEWKEVELNRVIKPVHRPIEKPKSRYRVLGIRSHCKGTFEKYIDDPTSVAMDELYIAKLGDLIVNITFAWEGAIAIVPEEHDGGLVSHRFPMYRPIKGVIDLDFLRYVVIQPRFKYLLGVISPGGAGRNRVLSKRDFLNLKIQLPEIDEQIKIGKTLRTLDNEIELLNMQLDAFQDQKKGLMQQLLTGKKRIKITEAA